MFSQKSIPVVEALAQKAAWSQLSEQEVDLRIRSDPVRNEEAKQMYVLYVFVGILRVLALSSVHSSPSMLNHPRYRLQYHRPIAFSDLVANVAFVSDVDQVDVVHFLADVLHFLSGDCVHVQAVLGRKGKGAHRNKNAPMRDDVYVEGGVILLKKPPRMIVHDTMTDDSKFGMYYVDRALKRQGRGW